MALSAEYCRRPALEEVINDPTVAKHYWRFRYGVRQGREEPSRVSPAAIPPPFLAMPSPL